MSDSTSELSTSDNDERHLSNTLMVSLLKKVNITGNKKNDSTPPIELLQKCRENIIQLKKENNKDDALIEELIRCTALSRIVYGDCHWSSAQSYAELAEGYLEVKQYPEQASQHAEHARNIMLNASIHTCQRSEDKPDILRILISIYHTLGKAQTILKKFIDAEHNLQKAHKCAEELYKLDMKEPMLDVIVTLSLIRFYLCQAKLDIATTHLEQILQVIIERCGHDSTQLVPVYLEQAKIEQSKNAQEKAVEILKMAYLLTSVSCKDTQEHLKVCYSLGTALCISKIDGAEVEGESYLQESFQLCKSLLGPKHAKTLIVLDDIVRLLVRTNRYKQAAKLLRNSIQDKIAAFGELATEVISSYKLLGSIYLMQDRLDDALKYLKECLLVETVVYGRNHRRSKMTEQAVQVILKSYHSPSRTFMTKRVKE